ncbi:MAG: helix-turn-helix domain-containing protein [Stackebrandtia sp.]
MPQPRLTRRQLGRRLKALREQADKSPYDVERSKLMGRKKLREIERGDKDAVSYAEVDHLGLQYGVSQKVRDELMRMAKATLEPGWWEPFGAGVPHWFQLYLELEEIACRIFTYEGSYVTGLLQTEATMRAILSANPRLDHETIERTVEARMKRQHHHFNRADGPAFEVVLDEGVVRRQVGGPEVHQEQLAHMLRLVERGVVRIWVMPFSEGAYHRQGRSFTLMEFPDEQDPSVIYSEAASGGHYEESPEEYQALKAVLEVMCGRAVTLKEFLNDHHPLA